MENNKILCETCDGKREAVFSCCTGDTITDDYMICPVCKEHLGEEECIDCQGIGYVDNDKLFNQTIDMQAKAELLSDINKEL